MSLSWPKRPRYGLLLPPPCLLSSSYTNHLAVSGMHHTSLYPRAFTLAFSSKMHSPRWPHGSHFHSFRTLFKCNLKEKTRTAPFETAIPFMPFYIRVIYFLSCFVFFYRIYNYLTCYILYLHICWLHIFPHLNVNSARKDFFCSLLCHFTCRAYSLAHGRINRYMLINK